MSDAYWRYGDSRQPPTAAGYSLVGKRPRADYDVPGGREPPSYFPRDDDRVAQAVRDNDAVRSSYDHYLRGQISSYGGLEAGRLAGSGVKTMAVDDPRVGGDPRMASNLLYASDPRNMGGVHSDTGTTVKGLMSGHGSGGRSEASLPPDATRTLFVEGLPGNSTRREVAHIFRPFVGYKEVRLVSKSKEGRHSGADPVVLCFVDFLTPAHAATAMDALQGYTFDEHDRDSAILRLQFSRYPGARSGGGNRGRR